MPMKPNNGDVLQNYDSEGKYAKGSSAEANPENAASDKSEKYSYLKHVFQKYGMQWESDVEDKYVGGDPRFSELKNNPYEKIKGYKFTKYDLLLYLFLKSDKSSSVNLHELERLITNSQAYRKMEQLSNQAWIKDFVDPDDPKNEKLLKEVEEEYYQNVISKAKVGGKMIMVTGLPGAGKSYRVKKNGFDKDYVTIDSDDIKALFPQYDHGFGARAVHKASGEIRWNVLKRLVKDKVNIILPTVGAIEEQIEKFMDLFKSYGDKKMLFADEKPETCVKRNFTRGLESGRLVPMSKVLGSIKGVKETYEERENDDYSGFTEVRKF